MAYDEALAARIRRILAGRRDVREQKMFGGLAFMVSGHMCCGVVKDELVIRLGADNTDRALREWHTRPMDFTGRPLKGFVFVAREGLETDDETRRWVEQAVDYVGTLQPK